MEMRPAGWLADAAEEWPDYTATILNAIIPILNATISLVPNNCGYRICCKINLKVKS